MARVIWDIRGVTAMLRSLATGPEVINELKRASVMAGFKVERDAKLNLTRMVYSQPERGYRRTGTLRRSVHVAAPGADHGGDLASARHTVLGGRQQSPSLVAEQGQMLIIEVGTWLLYAKRVHDGTGPRMTARPYLDDALTANQRFIEETIARGVANALRRAMG
jgi:hypothetical protein